jgi:signal transduction histidine kinase
VSRISHELRSPLNVIHGYTQLLRQLTLPQHAASHVQVVGQGVERMVQVVDDLLLLGQIDQGLLQIDAQAVPNDALVASLLGGAARCQWWTAGALVLGSRVGEVASVSTDPARFTSIAMLVAEASIAVQRGIEVTAFARGVRAGIQFVANADSPVVDAIWRPFLHSHRIPGSGMGLSVARSMASLLKVSMELREYTDGSARVALVLLGQIAG